MRVIKYIIQRNYSTKTNNNYYITTPIYYVNATPHIGHLYSSLIADATQRWHKLVHPQASIRFATGTDEHGTKIQQAANKNNVSPDKYCSDISENYRYMSDKFSIGYTNFIRTTDRVHKKAVHNFWKEIDKNGHIYSKLYGGWYCVSDETFLVDSQLKEVTLPNGQKSLVSMESGHPVEWSEEQNYMFKLSSFQDDLKYWLSSNENVIKPKKFQKILLDMISEESLPDVSISRPTSRVHWGIDVPGDASQTVYVWLDALVNYLTVAGYPESLDGGDFKQVWPPNLQVIGKDILKFHGIYWPAFLMAARLDPPKAILCHSHWTVDGEKMSKSKNNVVCPLQRSEIYTTDGLRYFLLREGVAHSDGSFVLFIIGNRRHSFFPNAYRKHIFGSNKTTPPIGDGKFLYPHPLKEVYECYAYKRRKYYNFPPNFKCVIFGIDLRYIYRHQWEFPDYSDVKIVRILNSEIADTLGNLLSRCSGSVLNPNQQFPSIEEDVLKEIAGLDVTKKLMESVEALPDTCYRHYEDYNFYKVADSVIATLHSANLFFETMKPWELKKNVDTLKHLDVVLHLTLESLRICSIILQPIIPNITNTLLDKIKVSQDRRNWEDSTRLSWKCLNRFEVSNLSPEKVILFQRILSQEDSQPKQPRVKKVKNKSKT